MVQMLVMHLVDVLLRCSCGIVEVLVSEGYSGHSIVECLFVVVVFETDTVRAIYNCRRHNQDNSVHPK